MDLRLHPILPVVGGNVFILAKRKKMVRQTTEDETGP